MLGACVRYLEGRKVKKGKAVEEADSLQSHLDDRWGVGFLGTLRALGSRFW